MSNENSPEKLDVPDAAYAPVIDDGDTPEKVALRKRILTDPEFRKEYLKRALDKMLPRQDDVIL